MSIVSSSHTPQGRGEEKGANYKWPHPVLPDFSSSGIGPRFISAQAALRQDPPRLPGAPRCREVRGEAARSRPPAGRGPGPPAVLPWPLPGAPRLSPPSPEATEPGLPATGSSRERRTHPRCSMPRCKAGRCGPWALCWRPGSARRPGGARGEIAVACTSDKPAVERGGHAASAVRFSERLPSLATRP